MSARETLSSAELLPARRSREDSALQLIGERPPRRSSGVPIEPSPPLASAGTLCGLAVAVVALVAFVFPSREDYAQLVDPTNPSGASLAYLEALTLASPDDPELQLARAKSLANAGEIGLASEILQEIVDDPRRGGEARTLRFELRLVAARALPEKSVERRRAFAEILELLPERLAATDDTEQLRALADLAASLERPDLAADATMRRVSVTDPAESGPVLAGAARWALAADDPARAAGYLATAAERAQTVDERRSWALRSLEVLEGGDVHAASEAALQWLSKLPGDRVMLERAIRLASAANRPKIARDLGRRQVAMGPADEALLRAQAKRELAAGDPKSALRIVEQLLAARPNDLALREAHARLAEWSGEQDLALEDWLFLASSGWVLRGLSL